MKGTIVISLLFVGLAATACVVKQTKSDRQYYEAVNAYREYCPKQCSAEPQETYEACVQQCERNRPPFK